MLEALLMVTLLCFNCEQSEQAYQDILHYQTVETGVVSEQLAQSWGAAKVAGEKYWIMQPASGEPVYLRFIHSDKSKDYQPMKQLGWNATEILAQDPDTLAQTFSGTDLFTVLAAPKFLSDKKNTRAFQAAGPNNELLYFTRIIDPKKAFYPLGSAQSEVGRIFIMVLGTNDLGATTAFYRDVLKMPVNGPYSYRISVLSKAHNLPLETKHNLSLVPLPKKFMLEVDQYPATAKPLVVGEGELPAGIAMVTFMVDSLAALDRLQPLAKAQFIESFPYDRRSAVTVKGSVGERIELIESPVSSLSQP
jgi:hypothetical protein